MTLNELLNQLDYDKLRFDYEFLFKVRMKDSPATKAKFVINFTKYDSELGKEIRTRKKVQSAFVKQWVHDLTHEEMKNILKENIEVDPAQTLSILVNIASRGYNKDMMLKYMGDNGIRRIKAMSMPEALSLIPLTISIYYTAEGIVDFSFLEAMAGFIGMVISALPHALRQRGLVRGYSKSIHDYIDRTSKEPGLLFCQDSREIWAK